MKERQETVDDAWCMNRKSGTRVWRFWRLPLFFDRLKTVGLANDIRRFVRERETKIRVCATKSIIFVTFLLLDKNKMLRAFFTYHWCININFILIYSD